MSVKIPNGILGGLWLLCLLAASWENSARAEDQSNRAQLFKPEVVYETKNRRDPFVQPQGGQWSNILEKVDIASLKLTGIIRNADRTMALFTSQTGPQFGYLLKAGKLYRENYQIVPGIYGEVRNPKEVVLRQDGREIIFHLK